jgi:hypothetical protein
LVLDVSTKRCFGFGCFNKTKAVLILDISKKKAVLFLDTSTQKLF